MTKSVFTEEYALFREMLIKARKEKGITQIELSEKLLKPQSFVSKYESGERRIDLIEFLEITRVLDVEPVVFFRDFVNSCRKYK
jgi:transcriptional regulator with XRE-family HTH domain